MYLHEHLAECILANPLLEHAAAPLCRCAQVH